MLFRFYCDESYDGKAYNPEYFTISGFFADHPTWEEIERGWNAINLGYSVPYFHASELNGRNGIYADWEKNKADEYSAELLSVINRQEKRIVAYNCGILGDVCRNIISPEGQMKLGHPWIMCFQSILAMVAKDMETLPVEDTFSVTFGSELRFEAMAVDVFKQMKKSPLFQYRHRLESCISGDSKKIVELQVADLMAYEYYKRLRQEDSVNVMRKPLELIRKYNNYNEGFFGKETFLKYKDKIESAVCGLNQLVIIPSL